MPMRWGERVPRPHDVAPSDVGDVVRRSGEPLDEATRAVMESRFDRSFGDVRVHADAEAQSAAHAVDAAAYTIGNHVVLGTGAASATPSGRRELLAHELAHVAQNAHAPNPASDLTLAPASDPAEREADAVSGAVARGMPARVAARPRAHRVHRALLPEEEARRKDSIARSYVTTVAIPTSDVASKLSITGARSADRSDVPSINPPPKTPPPSSLDAQFPSRPPGKSPLDDALLGNAPAKPPAKKSDPQPKAPERRTDAGTTLPPAPVPTPLPADKKSEKKDDGPGGAVQLGAGGQVTPAADTPGLAYLQLTLQWRDAYAISVSNLPGWIKELKFLGEPNVQLQYHLIGADVHALDAQVLANIVQASFEVLKRKLDVSIVAGAMQADILNSKPQTAPGKKFTPIPGGIDLEYNLVKITPSLKLNLDLQGLLGDAWVQPDPSKAGTRKAIGQGSGELRFVLEF